MIKCEICNREFKSLRSLGLHLSFSHKEINHKDYYDNYMKTENDGICPVCGNSTKWKGGLHGYARTCSISCGQKHPETRQKMSETNLERYGATNPYGSKEIREKIKKVNLERYGVKNPYNIPKIHTKAIQNSLNYHDDNGNESSWEAKLYNALIEHNIKFEQHYNKDSRYPYQCDFYLIDTDTFIEINGFWMHGMHWFNSNNKDDLNKLTVWKEKAKTSNMYKVAITVWTKSDLEKRDYAIKNNLNYIVLWTLNDIDNFIKSL